MTADVNTNIKIDVGVDIELVSDVRFDVDTFRTDNHHTTDC